MENKGLESRLDNMINIKDEIVRNILDSMSVTSEGNIEWYNFQSLKYNHYSLLLLSDLMLDNKFRSRLNALRYYFTSGNDTYWGIELTSVFKQMKMENKSTFIDFKQNLDSLLQNIEESSRPVKYELYYPLNIKTNNKIESIKFRDIQIEIKDYEEVKNILENPALEKELDSERLTKSKYKYIKVTLWSRNQNYAEQVATKYANLILGFIAYSQNYGHALIAIVGIPKELTRLKLNYIFAFKEESYSGYYYFEDKSDNRETYNLSDDDIRNLNTFVKQFNQANKKKQEVLFKTISLYYSGLTEKEINYSFLNFWKSLEFITLKKKGTPHLEITRRLKSIIKNLTPLDEYIIDRIYSLRNNLIHDGAYDISQYDRNLLKTYTEGMIKFFMFQLSKYEIQEIQTIFQFLQKDKVTLTKSKDLLDFVIKLKGER